MSRFKFSVGPWNVADGTDVYGPSTRQPIGLEEKIRRFAELGFSAVQFHDDDVVPDIAGKSEAQILEEAKAVKAMLDRYGLKAEFVAPRLWFDPLFRDGAYTAPKKEGLEMAMWRSFRSIDIARVLGCDLIVLWLAREGTLCLESKRPMDAIRQMIGCIDGMLDYDAGIRIAIEPKPNEPIDRSYAGTMGHALAVASMTKDPARVGGLLESAHAVIAGLDPAHEMAFALTAGKLWSVHLNDQNGVRFDQDRIFGSENLRSTFNQIKVLCDSGYGSKGEYVGLDVKAMRATSDAHGFKHLENSIRVVERMEAKVARFDQAKAEAFVAADDYEGLEMYVLELLMS